MHETLKRGLSGFIYVALLLFCTLHSNNFFIILFGILMLIASFEFSKLIKIPTVLTLFIGTMFYVFLIYLEKTMPIITLIAALVSILILLKMSYVLFISKPTVINKFEKWIVFIGYIAIPFALIALFPFNNQNYNPKAIISIFILIWINDTFAYLVGKNFGKNKLWESISPKKTIEGFVGGVLFSLLGGYFLSLYYLQDNNFKWICIALLISFLVMIGDLIESKIKREAGVKDSGKIMPGHGGILDRMDSIIFAIPFIYLLQKLF